VGGKFVLREVVGTGAMGTVFRAEQVTLGRTVAVKLLNASLARDATMVERFEKEARAASRLNHPNVVSIFDFGQTDDGILYIVMEFVRGRTLTEVILQDFPFPPGRLVDIGCQILAGLHEAHSQGVIHQDVKPDNVLVERLRTGDDHIKIADFGIARLQEEGPLLKDGMPVICGTPEYMAPEQIQGKPVDARSDMYAVGIVLYEMLTGERPFGGSQLDVLRAHLSDTPVPPSVRRPDVSIPPQIEALVMRALSKEPAERFESAAEFRAELEACVSVVRAPGVACPACGVITPIGSAFCNRCGVRLGGTDSLRATSTPTRPTLGDVHTEATPPSVALRSLQRCTLPFVGREPELMALERIFAMRDRGRFVVLAGPPGSGKTRLWSQVAIRLTSQGLRVVSIEPDPTGLASAWHPIRTAVSLLLGLPADVSRASLASACHLHGVDPANLLGLSELFGLQPADTGLELAVRRRECMAAALEVLRGTRNQPPTLVVFEDVDKYDKPSSDLLLRLAQLPGPMETHVLVTSVAAGMFETMPGVEVLALRELGVEECFEIVRHVLGTSPGARNLAERLAAVSAGLPLFVEQALWAAVEGAGGDESRSLGDLVAHRIDALSLPARRALQIVSVFGMEAPREGVEWILGQDGTPVQRAAEALSELEMRGFVMHRAPHVCITHPVLQELVYATIPVDVRRGFHAAVHSWLAGQGGASPAVFGFHGFSAGGGNRVLESLERAGRDAQRMFDDSGAMMHFQRGWQLARWQVLRGEVEAEPLMARLGLALGEAMRFAGDHVGAEGVLRETLEHCGDDHATAARAHRALGLIADHTSTTKARAMSPLRTALTEALRSGDPQLVAEMYLDLAGTLQRQGDLRGAAQELDEAIFLVTAGGGPEADSGPAILWRLLVRRAELALALGTTREAERHARCAVRHAERTGSAVALARTHSALADVLAIRGADAEAAEHRVLAVEWMRDLGDRRSTAQLLAALAQQELRSGAAEEARARLAEAQRLALAVEELT